MAIGDDFEIQTDKDIRHISGTATYTVLALHRWLQDKADDASMAGDDYMDITKQTPSERSTDNIVTLINGFNIDDIAAEFLYDGSILQKGGDELYSGLVVVGSVYGTTTLQVVQNNALYDTDTPFWGTGLNADATQNILMRCLIKTRSGGIDRDQKRILVWAREWGATWAEFSVTTGLGNAVAAIFTNQDLNNTTLVGTVATWTTITNVEGYQQIDLGNGNGNRPYYSKWNRDTYSINQLYERAKYIARRGTAEVIHTVDGELFRGITHQLNYDAESGGPFTEDEVIGWGCTFAYTGESGGPFVVGEKLTFGTSGAIGVLVLLDDAGTTGNMVIQVQSGTPGNGNTITGGTSLATATVNSVPANTTAIAGTGRILALLDSGTTGTMWIQVLNGGPPVDNLPIRGDGSNAICDVFGAVTPRSVSPVFLGQSTGSAIIGAFGIGIESADLTVNDKLFDLTNTLQQPPNNVIFYVTGLISGEDYVLVGPKDTGDDFKFNQLILQTSLSGASETAVVVTTAIPSDTPKPTGTIRIQLNSGRYRKVAYTSWSGSTFTIASTDFTSDPATQPRNVMISYIDMLCDSASEQFTSVYLSDRALWIRVRDGGGTPIKTFESQGSLASGGGSVAAIRTPDA